MKINMRRPAWSRLRWPIVAGLVAASAIGTAWATGWRFNTTPSEPLGLYRLTPLTAQAVIHRGDLISFCPPVALYPFMVHGTCSNGGAPFLKTVVGVPGDVVDVSAAGVSVDGSLLQQSKVIVHPKAWPGLTLPSAFGVHRLAAGEYWTFGAGDPKMSFDSRNWGVVRWGRIIAMSSG
ncbi:MAG: S26 family signal peptidase [Betaproteobacteria bacterium]|nr:S26 family signal peptidase [Betaproteobacteria bacterium]